MSPRASPASCMSPTGAWQFCEPWDGSASLVLCPSCCLPTPPPLTPLLFPVMRGKRKDLSSNKHLYTVHVADIFDTRSEEGNNQCIQHITQYLENRFVFPLADFEVRGSKPLLSTCLPVKRVRPSVSPRENDAVTPGMAASIQGGAPSAQGRSIHCACGIRGKGPSHDERDLRPPRVWPAPDQVTPSPLRDHSTIWQDTGPRGPQAQAPTVSDSVEGCAKAAGGPTSMITEIPSPHLDVFPALPKTIDMTTASLRAFLTSPAMLISGTNHSAIHSIGFITESRNRNRFTNRISTCTVRLLQSYPVTLHFPPGETSTCVTIHVTFVDIFGTY
ncbi:hypothetical protein MJG53_018827 [Ovis ammon polii x Ovis aries]|uniref:Uncharacterized protein n=1 Tax=Ovis ammon polii x Ovis aries TaxID=2918886 RepID=A0ACB9U3B2_9CETA|nr:hypothetical protein MJG53_018827 [Ovis ammon polii x Ovis aries]